MMMRSYHIGHKREEVIGEHSLFMTWGRGEIDPEDENLGYFVQACNTPLNLGLKL